MATFCNQWERKLPEINEQEELGSSSARKSKAIVYLQFMVVGKKMSVFL